MKPNPLPIIRGKNVISGWPTCYTGYLIKLQGRVYKDPLCSNQLHKRNDTDSIGWAYYILPLIK